MFFFPGCRDPAQCNKNDCPAGGPSDECHRFGCCNTNLCVMTNWIVVPDLPFSFPTSSISTTQEPAPSSPVSKAIKQPVSMTTGQPMVKMTSASVTSKSKIPTSSSECRFSWNVFFLIAVATLRVLFWSNSRKILFN